MSRNAHCNVAGRLMSCFVPPKVEIAKHMLHSIYLKNWKCDLGNIVMSKLRSQVSITIPVLVRLAIVSNTTLYQCNVFFCTYRRHNMSTD